VLSPQSIAEVGTGILLGGGVVLCWFYTWGRWAEWQRDWRDFREAAMLARANRLERDTFARGKACRRCHVRLDPRRLFRAVRNRSATVPGPSWVYRCHCGESTLYDAAGKGCQLEPASAA